MGAGARYCQFLLARNPAGRAADCAGGGCTGAQLWMGRGRDTQHEPGTPPVVPGDGGLMASTLTRMAERAIGAMPVAMPLVRPIFAAPQKLVQRDLEKPLT